jgi:hypothetical protein
VLSTRAVLDECTRLGDQSERLEENAARKKRRIRQERRTSREVVVERVKTFLRQLCLGRHIQGKFGRKNRAARNLLLIAAKGLEDLWVRRIVAEVKVPIFAFLLLLWVRGRRGTQTFPA